jgi:hypothetical protein
MLFGDPLTELLKTDPLAWYQKMAQERGALLRFLLERGTDWPILEKWVDVLSKNKKTCMRIYMSASVPHKIRLEKIHGED